MFKKCFVITVLVLTGCNHLFSDPKNGELVLKTYVVPDGFQEEIQEVANRAFRALSEDKSTIARVEVLPNGNLALVAPEKIHSGFAEMIKNIETRKDPGPKTATLQCWMIVGKRGEEAFVSPALSEISKVTQALQERGINQLYLLDRSKISSNLGGRAHVRGEYFEVIHLVNRVAGQWVLEFNVEGKKGILSEINTRVQLGANQFVLLGESRLAVEGGNLDPFLGQLQQGEPPFLFYVIRVLDSEERI